MLRELPSPDRGKRCGQGPQVRYGLPDVPRRQRHVSAFRSPLSGGRPIVIIWLHHTHGAGKTTTGALVQQLIPESRVFDAEKVGETVRRRADSCSR
jgi:hypothetical protein